MKLPIEESVVKLLPSTSSLRSSYYLTRFARTSATSVGGAYVTECMDLITIVLLSNYDFMYVTEHGAELYTNFL